MNPELVAALLPEIKLQVHRWLPGYLASYRDDAVQDAVLQLLQTPTKPNEPAAYARLALKNAVLKVLRKLRQLREEGLTKLENPRTGELRVMRPGALYGPQAPLEDFENSRLLHEILAIAGPVNTQVLLAWAKDEGGNSTKRSIQHRAIADARRRLQLPPAPSRLRYEACHARWLESRPLEAQSTYAI